MASDVSKLSLEDATDPTGHGQPYKAIMYAGPNGPINLGVGIFQHGGNLLAMYHGNPSPSAEAAAVIEEVNGRIRISEG